MLTINNINAILANLLKISVDEVEMNSVGYNKDSLCAKVINDPNLFNLGDDKSSIAGIPLREATTEANGALIHSINNTDLMVKVEKHNDVITGLLENYFKKHTNKLEGKLVFQYMDCYKSGVLEKSFIRVVVSDYLHSLEARDRELLLIIDNEKKIDIDSLIEAVEEKFIDFKVNEVLKEKKKISHTIMISENNSFSKLSISSLNNLISYEKHTVSYGDKFKMVIYDSTSNKPQFRSYVNIEGMIYDINEIDVTGSLGESKAYYKYLLGVYTKLNYKSDYIPQIVNRINKTLKVVNASYYKQDDMNILKTEKQIAIYVECLSKLELLILESISAGLGYSLRASKKKIMKESLVLFSVNKESLEKYWNKSNDKSSAYTRTIEI